MRIEINEPQAIWENGQQAAQLDNIYPPKGEGDQADRIFIVSSGKADNGLTSKDVIKNISGYFRRYRSASGEISDDDIRAAIDTCRSADTNALPNGISLVMLCLHPEGMTIVSAGNCRAFQIRPSAKRVVYENSGGEKVTLDNPLIYHSSDVLPGDFLYLCTKGMMAKYDSDGVCQFFSEEGSNDKKRNILRSSTADVKDNHAAMFIKVASVIGDDGSEASARRTIVIPEIKSVKPLNSQYDLDDEDDETEVGTPVDEGGVEKPQPEAIKPKTEKPKKQPETPKRATPAKPLAQKKHSPRPISQYEDERRQTNTRMVVLVAAIVVLAIAAGMLWYFNSSSPRKAPVDTTAVEPEKVDTTATPVSEPADSAIIPDSAIAEPERTMPVETHHKKADENSYNSDVEPSTTTESTESNEPTTTEPEHSTTSEPAKSATKETPSTDAPASSTDKAQ